MASAKPTEAFVEVDENFDIEICEEVGDKTGVADQALGAKQAAASSSQAKDSEILTQDAVAAVEEGKDEAESAPVAFEGEGLAHIGSAKAASSDFDDEFDYAFEGGDREGETHKKVFKPKALPAHLVTNVKQAQLNAVMEDGEEEGEEVDMEEGDEGADSDVVATSSSTKANGAEASALEGQFDAATQRNTSMPGSAEKGISSAGSDSLTCPEGIASTEDSGRQRTKSKGSVPDDSAPIRSTSRTSIPASILATAGTAPLGHMPSSSLDPNPSAGLSSAASGNLADSSVGGDYEANSNWATNGSTGGQKHPGSIAASATSTKAGEQSIAMATVAASASVANKSEFTESDWDMVNQERLLEVATASSAPMKSSAEAVTYPDVLKTLMTRAPLDQQHRQSSADAETYPDVLKSLMTRDPLIICTKTNMYLLCTQSCAEAVTYPDVLKSLMTRDPPDQQRKTTSQARITTHWEDLGFQGQDPATDLRSCGILGLVHLYYLHHHSAHNAQLLYSLSRSASQEFPLSIVSMNITKWTLQGLLSGAANRSGSMVETSSHFYIGTFYTFYNIWLTGGKTMAQSGFVLKDVEARSRKVQKMIDAASLRLEAPIWCNMV
eukprot:gene15734-21856_t